MENNGNNGKSYVCECCNYTTEKKDKFNRHLESAKHIKNNEKVNKNKEKEAETLKKAEKAAEKAAEKQVKEEEILKKQAEKAAEKQVKEEEILKKQAEKQAEKQAKEAEILKKQAEKQAKEQAKEAEKIRDKLKKEELFLLKFQEQEKDRIRKEKNREENKAEKEAKQAKAEAKQAKAEEKQEKKEEEKQEKKEIKEQKEIAKTKAEIEEAIPFDVTMMSYSDLENFPEFKFSWVKEAIGNHFFSNLLIALKRNTKTYNVRIINKQVEKWERLDGDAGNWYSKCPMEGNMYDFSDIQRYLKDLAYNCPLLKKYHNQLGIHCNDLENKPTYIGECKRILEGREEYVLQQRQQQNEQNDERVLAEREHIPTVDEARKAHKKVSFSKPESESEEENQVIENIEIESE